MGILIAIKLGAYFQGHNNNSQRSNCDSGNRSNSKKKWLPRIRTPHAKQDHAYVVVVGCQGKMEGGSKPGSKRSQRHVHDVNFNNPEVGPTKKNTHVTACTKTKRYMHITKSGCTI